MMNRLTSRREQGYAGLREVCYRQTEDLDLEWTLNDIYDVVTVSYENHCYAYNAYDLVSDEIDAKRMGMVSGYPEYIPFWVRGRN
jgi:hypothetical protein